MKQVPLLPGAREAANRGVRTGGADRNRSYLAPMVDWNAVSEVDRVLMIDPQTSGGLLVAVPPDKVARYLSLVPEALEIGEVLSPGPMGLVLA